MNKSTALSILLRMLVFLKAKFPVKEQTVVWLRSWQLHLLIDENQAMISASAKR